MFVFIILISALLTFICPNSALGAENQVHHSSKKFKNSDSYEFALFADFLYMRAYNSDLFFASEKKVHNTPGSVANLTYTYNGVVPEKFWKPGFRLGWSLDLSKNDLAIYSDWTYYYNKSSNNYSMPSIFIVAAPTEGFLPFWAMPIRDNGTVNQAYYQNMNGTWHLNYNVINLVLAQGIRPMKSFFIQPYFGLQNGWIHQKSEILYSRYLALGVSVANQFKDQVVRMTNNFWGIGVVTGIKGSWLLGAGFHLLADVTGSLLRGRTTNRSLREWIFKKEANF